MVAASIIKDDISFRRCFNETLFHPSTFPYLSCKLLLVKTKSPKIASWPGILTSDKETRTKVVLARKLGNVTVAVLDEGVAKGKEHDAGLDGDLAQEVPHLPHHPRLTRAHCSLKHQGQVSLRLAHHCQPFFP